MADELTTKPTLETLLEMMREVRDGVERVEVRLDRMDGFAHKTYSELVEMRADFRELKTQLKEHLPAMK